MNPLIKYSIKQSTKQSGFTLIEILVTLAVAAIVTTTAVPAIGKFVINHELSSAQQDIAMLLRKAKQVARTENTNITVSFTQVAATRHTVKLKRPNGTTLQTINMGKVYSNTAISFTFNSIGTVSNVGTITLVSDRDNTRSESISINTLFGQISLG